MSLSLKVTMVQNLPPSETAQLMPAVLPAMLAEIGVWTMKPELLVRLLVLTVMCR